MLEWELHCGREKCTQMHWPVSDWTCGNGKYTWVCVCECLCSSSDALSFALLHSDSQCLSASFLGPCYSFINFVFVCVCLIVHTKFIRMNVRPLALCLLQEHNIVCSAWALERNLVRKLLSSTVASIFRQKKKLLYRSHTSSHAHERRETQHTEECSTEGNGKWMKSFFLFFFFLPTSDYQIHWLKMELSFFWCNFSEIQTHLSIS